MGAIGTLIPLVILFGFVGGFAWVGYQMYLYTNDLADRGRKHMEKRNMTFTQDGGLKVGVKQLSAEEYADKTQSYLVNAWNHASFPGYKSRLWNTMAPEGNDEQAKSSGKSSASPSRAGQSSKKR